MVTTLDASAGCGLRPGFVPAPVSGLALMLPGAFDGGISALSKLSTSGTSRIRPRGLPPVARIRETHRDRRNEHTEYRPEQIDPDIDQLRRTLRAAQPLHQLAAYRERH